MNIANSNIYSTNTLTFVNDNNIFSINYVHLSNISTAAGAVASGGVNLWANYPAITNINVNSNSVYSTINVALINNENSINLTYITLSNISTAAGQSISTGRDIVPHIGYLETFSTSQANSNIRYDGVSTAFVGLSNNVYLLSTTLISTISTWTGVYGGDPTLLGRVSALETFSTTQTTSNIRYNAVSTALLTVSTTAGQGFSTGQGLVPSVSALETFSTSQTTSNIRYDAVSTALLTVSTTAGQGFSTGQGLVPNVSALETFSTAQTTSNIRYDAVSTALLTVSTTAGQGFSTGQGLVPSVSALETFSTAIISALTTSNIRANTTVFSSIVTSSISTFTTSGTTNIQQVTELIDFEVNATGNWPHNFNNGSIFYHTNIASNFTTALFNVPSVPGRSIVTTLVLNQGATPYYSSTLTINGSATPIQWVASAIPVPAAFKTECETFTLLNIGGTWTALGQYTSFGTV